MKWPFKRPVTPPLEQTLSACLRDEATLLRECVKRLTAMLPHVSHGLVHDHIGMAADRAMLAADWCDEAAKELET